MTRHPESAKAIIGDAHELGNHSCSHRSLLYADEEEITREIREFNRITEALLEYRAPVFRPPYGAYNGLILAKAHREGQRTVLWSLDSRDWISASGRRSKCVSRSGSRTAPSSSFGLAPRSFPAFCRS